MLFVVLRFGISEIVSHFFVLFHKLFSGPYFYYGTFLSIPYFLKKYLILSQYLQSSVPVPYLLQKDRGSYIVTYIYDQEYAWESIDFFSLASLKMRPKQIRYLIVCFHRNR